MTKRRHRKRKATKIQMPRKAAAERRGGTEFDAHIQLARKLVKKLRRKVAALRLKKKRK